MLGDTDDALVVDTAAYGDVFSNGETPIDGLLAPKLRTSYEDYVGIGARPGPAQYAARQIVLPLLAPTQQGVVDMLGGLFSQDPSAIRDLRWTGVGGWEGQEFRCGVLLDESPAPIDRIAGTAGVWGTTATLTAPDPRVYGEEQETVTINAGGDAVVDCPGTYPSGRLQVTWWGPLANPGVTSSIFPGGGVIFKDVILDDGELITAIFDRWNPARGVGSFGCVTFPGLTGDALAAALWGKCVGYDSSSYPAPVWFDIHPGEQTITCEGTGAGHLTLVYRPAYMTPPAT